MIVMKNMRCASPSIFLSLSRPLHLSDHPFSLYYFRSPILPLYFPFTLSTHLVIRCRWMEVDLWVDDEQRDLLVLQVH